MSSLDDSYGFFDVPAGSSVPANRAWWDAEAPGYYVEHGHFLGDDELTWGPEGLREPQAGLLGEVAGLDVLEVGGGAGQGGRWCAARGARVVALDLSAGMLARGLTLNHDGAGPAFVQADACRLPFAADCFDLAFSAYGAVPFVERPELVMQEVARVLRPGGRWVFSVTHPIRWAFPDDPGPAGLTVAHSYFDRRPYRELDDDGRVAYVEHHRTMADRVADIVGAGLVLEALLEPEWPPDNHAEWGGWSPERGRLIPGTAVFCTRLPR